MYRGCVVIPQSIGNLLQCLALLSHCSCNGGFIIALLIAAVTDASKGYAFACGGEVKTRTKAQNKGVVLILRREVVALHDAEVAQVVLDRVGA